MRVLVTGATGIVGSAIVAELLRRGHAVRALVRGSSDLSNLEGASVELVRGDVLDPAAARDAVRGCEAVVHAAGLVGFRAGEAARYEEVNVRGVEVVLGAAAEAGVRRALLTSTAAVLGGRSEPSVADEAVEGNAEVLGIPYFVTKLRGERAALALSARDLEVVVLRPAVVLGPGDIHGSSASLVTGLARRRVPAFVAGGASYTDARDVARAHAEALVRGRPGEAYLLGGHDLTTAEFVARVCALAGVPAPPRVPYAVALAVAALSEAVARARGRRARLTRDLIRATSLYTYVSSAKAARELGYAARPFDESLRDTLRWAVTHGRLRPETAELRELARA